jgi:hypothetical protein
LDPKVINIISNCGDSIAVYRGRSVTIYAFSKPGDRALVIDGARVPNDDLDAWYRETMEFDWHGQPFGLHRYRDGRVYGAFLGKDLTWPQGKGLDGNQYEGWFLEAPEREIDNVRVVKTDILERERYSHTFNVDPPPDLFVTVRPATDQEWVKE